MKGVQRVTFAFDNHGNKAHAPTLAAFWEFDKFWRPDKRIHGGDGFNLACLRKNATEGEKRERLQDDIDQGIDFLKRWKPDVFLRGNHDERLWDAAKSDDGKLADFASYLILDIKEALGDARMFPYSKTAGVLKLGNLSVIHGYHGGVTAARLAAQVYGNVAMGHVHAKDISSASRYGGAVGYTSGALCELDQDYNRAHANTIRQSNGWMYGLLFRNGDFILWHAEKKGGHWIFPSEFREVKA